MKEFGSFLEAAAHMTLLAASMGEVQRKSLDRAAAVVQKEAKAIVGNYQEGAGPLAPWQELADSTKEDRLRKGFTENVPELRTGGLRDGIERAVLDSSHAAVGSNDDVMVYQELGTKNMPPRSMLGIAAVHKGEHVAQILGEDVTRHLVGEKVHEGSIDL